MLRSNKTITHPIWLLMPAFGCFVFVFFTVIAMIFYPGGTFLNSNTVGYRFWENYFSDLGRTVARNGEPNAISNICFAIATIVTGLSLIPFFFAMQDFFRHDPKSKAYGQIIVILAIPMAISYLLVGLGPADTMRLLHYGAMFIAFILTIIALLCLIIAIWRSKQYPRRYIGLNATIILIICFFIFSQIWGPRDTTIFGLHWQVSAQKITILGEAFLMGVQGIGAYYSALRSNQSP